jgi:hypothetical protein
LQFVGVSNTSTTRAVPLLSDRAPHTRRTRPVGHSRHVQDSLADQFSKHVERTVTSYRRLLHRFLRCKGSKGRSHKKSKDAVTPDVLECAAAAQRPRFS